MPGRARNRRVWFPSVSALPEPGRLQCPYCDAYAIDRLYLASLSIDSCVCDTCGARWDEDASTGAFRGRQSHARTSGTQRS